MLLDSLVILVQPPCSAALAQHILAPQQVNLRRQLVGIAPDNVLHVEMRHYISLFPFGFCFSVAHTRKPRRLKRVLASNRPPTRAFRLLTVWLSRTPPPKFSSVPPFTTSGFTSEP